MSKKDGYSRPGLFGSINHYDSKGHKIGESRPGFFGGYNDYDAKGHKIGETRPGFFGGMNYCDRDKRWTEPKKYDKISIRNEALKSGADGE